MRRSLGGCSVVCAYLVLLGCATRSRPWGPIADAAPSPYEQAFEACGCRNLGSGESARDAAIHACMDRNGWFHVETDRLMRAAMREPDQARARQLMEEAAALGHPEAINGLGFFTLAGIGAEPDEARGVELLEEALETGSKGAGLNLGAWLVESEKPEDQQRGVELLTKAYADPKLRAQAARGLAIANLFGRGVEANLTRGVDLLEEADQRDPRIGFLLGRTYESGWGGRPQDPAKAYAYFLKAAELGNAGAAWKVGMALLEGNGVEADEQAAYRWVRKSAEAGDPRGEISLAVMLATGQGVREDDQQARVWYEKGVERGMAHALRSLGSMLLTGEGGPADPVRGLAYLQLASDAGEETAAKILQSLQTRGIPQAEVDRIKSEWISAHGRPTLDP